MCGIAGILNYDSPSPADPQVLAEMLQRIVHRGPDDDGQLVDGPLAMGMRRLSIIDLDGGKQPIFDETGRWGIVFNGEIYNYRQLRAELEGRGHRFATRSDTEVIVHLYEEIGERCVDRLRGMFAFAVWDRDEQSLFIARDRLGIKPLYYTQPAGSLIFGSEIKSLVVHPGVEAKCDLLGMSDYLSLKYVPAPRTLFQNIYALPPGHSLSCRAGQVHVRRYWDLSFQSSQPRASEEEYVERLTDLLRESVRMRLVSDVPFGAFLSGGVDSSTVVALMSEMLSEPVKTFSVGFDGSDEADELPFARQVAQQYGCDHHEIVVTAADFMGLAEKVLWHLDQPIADQATIATQMVAQLARRHVKMVLTGEGGDELFAGYARYVGEQYAPWFRYLPPQLGGLLRSILPKLPGGRRPKIAAYALSHRNEADRFWNWFPLFNSDGKRELMTSEMWEACGGDVTPNSFSDQLASCDTNLPLNRMLYVDTKLWLPDYLLLRGDKLTMANSLEARVPLLDHELVEFAASLPPEFKLRGRQRKYLLKQVAAKLLPRSVIDRPKQGFPIPIDTWLRGPAREMVHDVLTRDSVHARGYFRWSAVERLIREHESGFADHSIQVWGLVSLEMWHRHWIDGSADTMPGSASAPTACAGVSP